ncbi:MAG: hypothetical protein JW982_05285 [Spirochaetes bacterium]|nr:hypothetical protein [Spirochaetota bacterium]
MIKRAALFFISVLSVLCLNGVVYSQENERFVKYEMAKTRFDKGLVFYNQMNYLAAVEYFRQALSIYNEYHVAREYLARSYKLAGYCDSASTEWRFLYDDTASASVKHKIDVLNNMQGNYFSNEISDKYVDSFQISSKFLKNYKFSYPADIVMDNENSMYITSFSNGNLVKIDNNGNAEKSVKFASDSVLYGLDYRDGVVAVSDFNQNKIYFVDRNLKKTGEFGTRGFKEGQLNGPQGLAFDNSGNIFVVDTGNNRIQKFNKNGKFVLEFGRKGKYKGDFDNPTDAAVYNDRLFITDTGNSRICEFDLYGNFKRYIESSLFSDPRGITLSHSRLIISDMKKGLIFYNLEENSFDSLLDPKGGVIKFSRLINAVRDRYDNIVAVDHDREEIRIFTPVNRVYNNLDVSITSIDTHSFPIVAVYLNVNDIYGNPVYNLNQNNFAIIEDGARVPSLYTGYFKEVDTSVNMVVAVEKTPQMKTVINETLWSMDNLLAKVVKTDKIMVNNFNIDYWTAAEFDWSIRRTKKAAAEDDYTHGNNISKVIYNSLNSLVALNSKRGLVVYTSGILDDNSFSDYDKDILINFARTHFIPVYFIYTEEMNPDLRDIAERTGGRIVHLSDAEKTSMFYDEIRNREEYRYSIIYRTYKTREFSKWWADIQINASYQNKKGIEWGGYFVP